MEAPDCPELGGVELLGFTLPAGNGVRTPPDRACPARSACAVGYGRFPGTRRAWWRSNASKCSARAAVTSAWSPPAQAPKPSSPSRPGPGHRAPPAQTRHHGPPRATLRRHRHDHQPSETGSPPTPGNTRPPRRHLNRPLPHTSRRRDVPRFQPHPNQGQKNELKICTPLSAMLLASVSPSVLRALACPLPISWPQDPGPHSKDLIVGQAP